MTEATTPSGKRHTEEDGARLEDVREAAAQHASKHTREGATQMHPHDPEAEQGVREAFCETVKLFDYGECELHLRGLPTRAKIKELHRYWFDTGVPLVVDLKDPLGLRLPKSQSRHGAKTP